MVTIRRPIPIYTSKGELGAFLVYPYVYNVSGEWIGWITPERDVISVIGHYVGYLNKDPRILRKRTMVSPPPRTMPYPTPQHLNLPAYAPLAPMLAELPYDVIDVLQDCPELLHTMDSGELKDDMD